jgi:hypothetical protein
MTVITTPFEVTAGRRNRRVLDPRISNLRSQIEIKLTVLRPAFLSSNKLHDRLLLYDYVLIKYSPLLTWAFKIHQST